MFVINARNVNDALFKGLDLIRKEGILVQSRNGPTLEIPCPVATVYQRPNEKVLISAVRDANPFFHLMESMWILAGRSDVKFLTEFNSRMSDYSDNGIRFNAPYGERMRFTTMSSENLDQIKSVIDILRKDSNSRQAVIQIWDPKDLNKTTKDKACNMSVVFRVREMELDMTVYNRSNDMIWGAYGANVVQFSMLQEYIAAYLNLRVGEYTQITNSYHVYTDGVSGDLFKKLVAEYLVHQNVYDSNPSLVELKYEDMLFGDFDNDLTTMFNVYDSYGKEELFFKESWKSKYFKELISPVMNTHIIHKKNGPEAALEHTHNIKDSAWRAACQIWLRNRARNSK